MSLLVSQEGNPVQAAFQHYADDLSSPQVFDVELFRWRRKWLNADRDHLPISAAQALEECNPEFIPNKLLRILCTLPITSAECERSFSTLRRLKTYLRATMTSERESGLALMNIHHGRQIDISETGESLLEWRFDFGSSVVRYHIFYSFWLSMECSEVNVTPKRKFNRNTIWSPLDVSPIVPWREKSRRRRSSNCRFEPTIWRRRREIRPNPSKTIQFGLENGGFKHHSKKFTK